MWCHVSLSYVICEFGWASGVNLSPSIDTSHHAAIYQHPHPRVHINLSHHSTCHWMGSITMSLPVWSHDVGGIWRISRTLSERSWWYTVNSMLMKMSWKCSGISCSMMCKWCVGMWRFVHVVWCCPRRCCVFVLCVVCCVCFLNDVCICMSVGLSIMACVISLKIFYLYNGLNMM